MLQTDPFELVTTHAVPPLGIEIQEYRHPCGAIHVHLGTKDEHRAFCVGFRTVPEDSTGLPHILEHLSLCGSKQYPVRDPFFMMLRRSLQTFMNAFTYPDMTAYPFSTQVTKDFDNLLGIYLDAVFEPNLDANDFAQEGWRLEPAEFPLPDNSDPEAVAEWAIKGIVYNEMKGAMGDTDSLMFQALGEQLLPDTCYQHNSGGEPACIPDLVHADLVAFHQSRYCGANAFFGTYGDIDCASLHERFEPYLQNHPGTALPPASIQAPFSAARAHDVSVPLDESQSLVDVSSICLSWALGDIGDLQEVLLGEMLDRLLLGHAAAPLRLALDSSHLGRSCGNSGYMAYLRNGVFSIELEGVEPARYDEFEPLVMATLQEVADKGFSTEDVDAALHQVELARRAIGGEGMPFGLQLCLRGLMAWNHGRQVASAIDQDPAIAALKDRVGAEGFWQDIISSRLLNNPHRVLLRAQPDTNYMSQRDEAEAKLVAARMEQADKAALVGAAAELAERQASPPDPSCLPELLLSDVPESLRWADVESVAPGLARSVQATNGILHCYAAIPLPDDLTESERDILPLFASTIGSLGAGTCDYQDQARRLTACSGGLHAWYQIGSAGDDLGKQRGFLFAEVRGLADRREQWLPLLPEALSKPRFDEVVRMRELLEEGLNGLQNRLLHAGHELAIGAACRALGGTAALSYRMSGIGRLHWLRALLEDEAAFGGLSARLQALSERLQQQSVHLALVGDSAAADGLDDSCRSLWSAWKLADAWGLPATMQLPAASTVADTAFTMASPVQFCAWALPTVPLIHADSAALAVTCQYLKDQYLHRCIREQGGAYGALAGYSSSSGIVSFGSYRDPRLDETFADFVGSIEWLQSNKEDADGLRSAILGRIATLDTPSSPAGEGRRRFIGDLMSVGPEQLGRYRQTVLHTSWEDMQRVAANWLKANSGVRAVITSQDAATSSSHNWAMESIVG